MHSPVYPPIEYDTCLATDGCGCLRASEKAWRKVLQEYKIETRAPNADKKVFAALLAKLLNRSVTPSQPRAGFSTTGIAHSITKPSPMQRSQRQFRSQALQREGLLERACSTNAEWRGNQTFTTVSSIVLAILIL